ncbi:MAG TPA: MFS transporter [Casimicrobiaceae bacterium]|nr:MFS transporter [Casimicrobiaceae bacterium]
MSAPSLAAPRHAAGIAWVTTATSFGFALIQLDVTIVNVALPRIAVDLRTDIAGLQWVVDAYALAFAVLLLSGGLLADRLGAKRLYLAGLAVFAATSALCALSVSAATLIGARALQGVGAALMLPTSLALLNHAAAGDRAVRARAVGWWTAAGSITIAAGPIIGGALLALAGWRSIFWVNLPVCALGAWLTLRVCPAPRDSERRGFDLPGQLLAIVALTSLTASVIEAHGNPYRPLVLAGLALALTSAFTFVRVEARARVPMLPLALFRQRGFSVAIVYGVAVNLTYYGIVFVLTLYLQRIMGYTALQTGLAYLPLTATFFIVNVASGAVVTRFGVRGPMVVGALVDACGFALLSALGPSSSYLWMLPAFALLPLGMGTGVPAMTTSVLSSVDASQAGVASAALNAARQAGGAIGVALFGGLAGDGVDRVVEGLHHSAYVSITLLAGAAVLAYVALRAAQRR